ncbi:MAG: hypothetical protein AzoDbin1_04248 [Azoarcus sp.]|nr:hypothetical protein [Azoarcus sp.]
MTATMIVPPMYEAQIHGVTAVRITARKVELLDGTLRKMQSVFYRAADQVGTKSFAELVAFVRGRGTTAPQMTVHAFQQIAAVLLRRHYGLELNDTNLWDQRIVALLIAQGLRPYQVVNVHATESDLDRIDKSGFYGVPSKEALTEQDEASAAKSV